MTTYPSDELSYVSSQPLLVGQETAKPQDQADLSTLEQVLKLLHDRRAFYESVDSLTLDEKTLTIKQQLAINKKVLIHLQEIEGLVTNTINKVREIQNG